MNTKIGKIRNVRLGFGGYQDSMLGFSFVLGSDKECWGVGDFWGTWFDPPTKDSQWLVEDQLNSWGLTVQKVGKLLRDAKVSSIDDLKNIPIECSFENGTLKLWRILTEAV